MRIALLGPVSVYADDAAPVDIGGARLRMLLARLALDAGRAVPSDSLIDGLWDASPPADAANALQALVSRLRKALRGVAVLESVPGGYRLAVERAQVDAHRFEELAALGGRELAAGRLDEASSALGEALGLWRGTALADLPDAPFVGAAAGRLEDLRATAAEERFEAELGLGRHAGVIADLEAESGRHPLNERLAVLRMRAFYAAGRQSDALAVYERTRSALAEELGVDPSEELRRTQLAVLRGELDTPGRVAAGQLPGRLTSFVGRDGELELVSSLMETSRLVTIVGPGGVGKTRLAVEAARRLRAHQRGRAWFVSLAGVSPSTGVGMVERLADAVLGALSDGGLRPPPADKPASQNPIDRVVELLNLGESILILDNCEHLVADAAELAGRLLDRLPYLKILSTSREALGITGEALCQLAPLPETAAVELFVDRATAVKPGFASDEASGQVAEICARLDGLPLALELAAARLRSMSVEQIARRLDDRFRLLALPRQRTLLAVVEWSWELLTEQERVLARRLSIFPSGAGAAVVEAVCSDVGGLLPEEDVIYVLGSLVEKSIVVSEPRYRMLETVRAYAAERLASAGERETIAARLVRHFRERVTELEPALFTRDQLEAKELFDTEYDNVVLALRTAIDGGDAETSWRLLGPLWVYWNTRYDARSDRFMAEVVAFGDALPDHVRATFTAAHVLANNSGSFPTPEVARAAIEDCLRTGAIDHYPMLSVIVIGGAYFFDFTEIWEPELVRVRDNPSPWARAAARWVESFIRTDSGDWAGGRAARAAALRGFEELGERYGLAMTLISSGHDRSIEGEYGEALALTERSVAIAAELGTGEEVMHRAWLAAERTRGGDLEGARRDLEVARRLAQERLQPHGEIEVLLRVADLHRREGDLVLADRALDRLRELSQELSLSEEAIGTRIAPARMANLLAAGAVDKARELLPSAVGAGFAVRDVAPGAELLARLRLLEGDPAGAATALGMSEVIRGAFDQGEPELRALVAELVERLGQEGYDQAYRAGADLTRDAALTHLTT